MKPDENYIVIDGQGNVIDLVDEAGNGTTATEDFLGQLSLSALQGKIVLINSAVERDEVQCRGDIYIDEASVICQPSCVPINTLLLDNYERLEQES